MIVLFNAAYGGAGGGLRAMAECYESILPDESCRVHSFRIGGKRRSGGEGARHLPSTGHFNPLGCLLAFCFLVRYRPDVVICHCTRSLSLFRWPCGLLGIPTVGVTHNDKLRRFRKADYMIAFSSVLKRKLLDLDFPRERIRILPNPVTAPASRSSRPRFSNRLTGAPLRLGFLARLESRKGAGIAVQAMDCLRKRSIDAHLLLAGQGEEADSLKNQIAALGLADRVALPGWIADLDQFFSEVDLLLVPSNYESFGLTIVEAFARRVPVITSRFYCFAENYFTDRVNCILADSRCPEAFADAVQWCLEHPEKVDAVTDSAEKDFYERFEAGVVAVQLRSFLGEIAGQGR